MATPLSADRIVAALRDEGCRVQEVRSWRTHNRNKQGRWGPVNGVMIHHTVTRGTDATVDLCYDGHSTLPGPLCHGVIGKDGVIYLVGHGRANHAGLGDDDVLQAVIDERAVPRDNEANTDGNSRFYGFECENLGNGRDPWPAVQLEAIERAAAALCRAHGWSALSVIGHLEWQPGKIDPAGVTMASLRARIADRLDGKPAPVPDPIEAGGEYTVRQGDTLWAIARAHDMSVDRLKDINGLKSNRISPGQRLKVDAADDGPDKPAPRPEAPRFPGRNAFRIGYRHEAVTQLGRQLKARGFDKHHDGDGYQPGPKFTEYDRRNVADFQRSKAELRGDPDGYPGPRTWALLWA